MKQHTCPVCGDEFEPRVGGKPQRYCSKACYGAAATVRRRTNRVPKVGPCVICGMTTAQRNGTPVCDTDDCKTANLKRCSVRYTATHREQAREYQRRYYAEHSEYYKALRDKRTYGIPKWQTSYTTKAKVQARMAMFGGRCWICKVGPFEEIDHVKPLSKGGAHLPANLRPACRSCNRSKKDRWPFSAPTRIDQRIQVVQVH